MLQAARLDAAIAELYPLGRLPACAHL
jgi:hypothetical protein